MEPRLSDHKEFLFLAEIVPLLFTRLVPCSNCHCFDPYNRETGTWSHLVLYTPLIMSRSHSDGLVLNGQLSPISFTKYPLLVKMNCFADTERFSRLLFWIFVRGAVSVGGLPSFKHAEFAIKPTAGRKETKL